MEKTKKYYWYRSDTYSIVSPYFTNRDEALEYWWRIEDSPWLELRTLRNRLLAGLKS